MCNYNGFVSFPAPLPPLHLPRVSLGRPILYGLERGGSRGVVLEGCFAPRAAPRTPPLISVPAGSPRVESDKYAGRQLRPPLWGLHAPPARAAVTS